MCDVCVCMRVCACVCVCMHVHSWPNKQLPQTDRQTLQTITSSLLSSGGLENDDNTLGAGDVEPMGGEDDIAWRELLLAPASNDARR